MNYYYQKNCCKIYFDDECKTVVIQWFGFAESYQFREACNEALNLLAEMKTKFMIADNSEAKVLSTDDQKWMIDDWFHRAYQSGYRVSAVIAAKNIFRELALSNIINHLDKDKFTIQYFDNMSDAKNWIKKLHE